MTVNDSTSWIGLVLAGLNVVQVVALAWIAARYHRNGHKG